MNHKQKEFRGHQDGHRSHRNNGRSMIPLRDYYANTVLKFLLERHGVDMSDEDMARTSFRISDAMLRERRESYLKRFDGDKSDD